MINLYTIGIAVDQNTAGQVGDAVSKISWAGVILILSVLIIAMIPLYRWVFNLTKNQASNAVISEEQLSALLVKVNINCPILQKEMLTDLQNRIIKNRDIVEDIKAEVHTVKIGGTRIEESLDRVSKSLLDVIDSIRKIVRTS